MRCSTQTAVTLLLVAALLPAPAVAQDGGSPFWGESRPAGAGEPDVDRLIFRCMNAANGAAGAEFSTALAELEAAAPDHPAAHYYKAVRLARSGNVGGARMLLERLVAKPQPLPGVPEEYLRYDYAMVLSRMGELEEARRQYARAALVARPNLHEHIYVAGAAELSMGLGELDEAIRLYRRALELSPAYIHALFGMAVVMERAGRHDDARGYLLEGLSVDPAGLSYLGDKTVFIPAEDRFFAAGLIAEELGNHELAREQLELFVKMAAEGNHRFAGAGSEALSRVRKAGPSVVGSGPLPVANVTVAAADPAGRFLAVGNAQGQLVLVDLRKKKILDAPRLSGPGIVAAAFSGDTLLVGDDFGEVTPYATRGGVRRGAVRGPVALAGGTRILGMSSDGAMLVVSDPRARALQVADTTRLEGVRGRMTTSGSPAVVAVGPWSAERGATLTAIWTTARSLELVYGPTGTTTRTIPVPNPKPDPGSSTAWDAVTIDADGRRIILSNRRFVAVCRAADGKVIRLLDLGVEEKLGKVRAAIVDPKGAAGHGPALVTFHERGYRAVRLDLIQ